MGTTHMVCAGHNLAAAAGYRILEQGGNAVDAGVAAGIAINVTLPENTNFGMTDAFVIFLANTVRYLKSAGRGRVTFDYTTPLQAGPIRERTALLTAPCDLRPNEMAPAWPGVYRDASGRLEAVNVLGLKATKAALAPEDAVARAPLPEPRGVDRGVELWPMLAAAAVLLWLTGWAARLR